MNEALKVPVKDPKLLTDLHSLKNKLSTLIGQEFILTRKSRTDGSNLRKLVADTLLKSGLPPAANSNEYEVVPPKQKGTPKILREFIDTYIITSGKSYNLQVWNRFPASDSLLIKYNNEEELTCSDVRFVLVRVDEHSNKISSVFILSPKYIESTFGIFGKPTIKYQLLISQRVRQQIYGMEDSILVLPDTHRIAPKTIDTYKTPSESMTSHASENMIYSLNLLKTLIAIPLIGYKIPENSTKNRGQELERKVLDLMGYVYTDGDLLYGQYPDIPNQLLEVKIQDTQTVDLGKYTPEDEVEIQIVTGATTRDVRYLIALTNPETNIIEGIILSPGASLGQFFTYVSDKSYKCQRSIPMSFFDSYDGKVVVNPNPKQDQSDMLRPQQSLDF